VESFVAVKNAKTHFWASVILTANYFNLLPGLLHRLPVLWPIVPFLLRGGKAAMFRRHEDLTLAKIRKRIAMDNASRQDFFADVLSMDQLSEKQLAGHASLFIIAGAETTSTTLSGAVYILAQNPACLQRLKDEVRTAFKSRGEITGDAAAQLPYLGAVIEETMRYCPAVAIGLPRESPGEYVDGNFIPKGTIVSTDMFLMARDPRNFAEPDVFKPERWLNKDDPVIESMKGFNFSVGPRMCIGITLAYMEMRIVLAKLVFAFDWELADPIVDLINDSNMYLLWSRPEAFVKFRPRE
jgi:cytochrome P450